MMYFDGEKMVERPDHVDRERDGRHEDRGPGRPTSSSSSYGDRETQNLGEHQQCGGGRRIIRKKLSS